MCTGNIQAIGNKEFSQELSPVTDDYWRIISFNVKTLGAIKVNSEPQGPFKYH